MVPGAIVGPWLASAPPPLARALSAGLAADRLGAAFLPAYREALDTLVPGLPAARRSLAVTEGGPVHPRSLATRWRDGRLTGTKTFATGVPGADRIWVVARDEADRCVVVEVAADAPGLAVTPRPPTPFAPEVPHAALALEGVPGALLPVDGWRGVVKPFRTVEDTFVTAAGLAYLLAAAGRAGLGADAAAALAGPLVGLVALAARPPDDPAAHVALAGVLGAARAAAEGLPWPDDAEGARIRRDLPLLRVAEPARRARLDAAFSSPGG